MLPKLLLLLIAVLGAHAADPKPLLRAHAHNDYEHPRPLLDALDQGFCSVEADIHLVQGALLVAHDPEHVRPERTLENLYLEPLRRRAAENGGRIYRGGPPLILLIDIKTEAESTYAVLRTVLRRHESILTRFADGKICTNAVTVILSGNRPRATLLAEADRLAAFDGRIADLGQGLPAAFMPLVSDNFRSHFSWAGEGEMSPEELKKLQGMVDRAHREGRMVRFWAAPDTLNGWHLLRAAKVDLINTDQLAGLAAYLRQE
jgi:hypothetical protein